MKTTHVKNAVLCLAAVAALLVPGRADAGVKASYLYNLANFSGTVRYSWVRPVVDAERSEVYVLTGDTVTVFNDSGMEVYSFGEDLAVGRFEDVAVESDGNILLLSYLNDRFVVTRCDYRGEARSRIEIRNLPPNFAEFSPSRLFVRAGNIYLADVFRNKIAVTDPDGAFRKGYEVAPMIADFEKQDGSESNITGFTVDNRGNIFFTVGTIFKVFRLSPDGTLSGFGDAGNLPGKFNVVAGVATDDNGYIYVTDSLRAAVSVFDKDFNFQLQFSQRGLEPGSLIAPMELVVDRKGRVYVTQARNRGVSVFRVTYD